MNESMYFLNYGTWDFPANHVRFQECIPQLSGFFPEMEIVHDFKELHTPGNSRDGAIQNEASY